MIISCKLKDESVFFWLPLIDPQGHLSTDAIHDVIVGDSIFKHYKVYGKTRRN